MSIKTVRHPPYRPDLAPCDFWLFPKLRGCRYETIEEMKEAVMKVIDTLTRGLPWGPPEVVGTVQLVHCSRRRLLRRGQEFDVCTINETAHMKKVWKPFEGTSYLSLSIYIYTYNATRIRPKCFNELSTSVSVNIKCKQIKNLMHIR